MHMVKLVRGSTLAAMLVLAVGGCKSLDITNPNDVDAVRILKDPEGMEAFTKGSINAWINTWAGGTGPDGEGEGATNLVTMAQSYSASWNNANMNHYSSLDIDGTRLTRHWENDPSLNGRTSIEAFWEGYYGSMATATAALKAMRIDGLELPTPEATKRAETMLVLMQGAAMMGIALNYDKGYIIDETVDLGSLAYSNRKLVRDAALAKFDEVITLAAANSFITPEDWTNGISYSNDDIVKIANTMAAFTLVNWPRNPAEDAQVDWARVASYATNGLSSGTDLDFMFEGDGCTAWCPWIMYWFNGVDGGRVSTRVAAMIPGSNQTHPYPPGGSPPPNSPDLRMGDGSFGVPPSPSGMGDFGHIPITPTSNPGTDFMWSSIEIFNMARGSYHQSNIGHIRFDLTGTQSSAGIYGMLGPAPLLSAEQNDLMLAEALLRGPAPNFATAAGLINNSRVGRGGLTPATGAETLASLMAKLDYEYEIEAMGQGPSPYYHRRRRGGLVIGTPHEMPVPAKELGVFAQPLYTFGGTGPASSVTPP
jgi:hypothetical protein